MLLQIYVEKIWEEITESVTVAKGGGMQIQQAFVLFFFLILLLSPANISGRKSPENGLYHQQNEEDDESRAIRRSMFPDDFIFGVSTSAYQASLSVFLSPLFQIEMRI